MIYLMTGTPGSGKSLHMAMDIYYHIKMARPVIANFEINRKMFRDDARAFFYMDNEEITPDRLIEFSRNWFGKKKIKEGDISLYIDECSLMFNARDWNRSDRKGWIRFFQLHRKLGYNIYLVTQFDTMLDKQVRALVEYEIKHRKVNNVGWFGKFVSLFSFGHPVVCCVTYWYGQKMRLSSEFMLGRRKYFRLYDSYMLFDDLSGDIQLETWAESHKPGSIKTEESEKKITIIKKSA